MKPSSVAYRAMRRHRVRRQLEAAERKLRDMLAERERLQPQRLFCEEYHARRRKYLPDALRTLTNRIARLRSEAAELGLQELAA